MTLYAINNPLSEQAAAPKAIPTKEPPQDAPQAVRDDATQGAGTPRTTAA